MSIQSARLEDVHHSLKLCQSAKRVRPGSSCAFLRRSMTVLWSVLNGGDGGWESES